MKRPEYYMILICKFLEPPKHCNHKSVKISKFFFSIFFSIEIILREGRLRTQNIMTLGLTVSEIQGVTNIRTDTQTNFVSNIDERLQLTMEC